MGGKNKEGKRALKIIIRISGKRIVKSLNEFISPDDWTGSEVRKSHPQHQMINLKIKKRISEIEQEIRRMQLMDVPVTPDFIQGVNRSFCEYFSGYIDGKRDVLEGSTLDTYRQALARIQEFDKSITLHGITPRWLALFHQHLARVPLEGNTIHKLWKKMRTVYLDAMHNRLTSEDPFKKYPMPKYQNPDRIHLTLSQVQAWERALKLPMSETMLVSGMYFLLGCYSGLRISDWLRFSSEFIREDRLILRAKKNGQLVSLQMHDKLKQLTEKLLHMRPCPAEPTVNENLKAIAKMCNPEIDMPITSHVGRHTFAVRCLESGITSDVVAEYMGISRRTVAIYAKVTNPLMDAEFKKFRT